MDVLRFMRDLPLKVRGLSSKWFDFNLKTWKGPGEMNKLEIPYQKILAAAYIPSYVYIYKPISTYFQREHGDRE